MGLDLVEFVMDVETAFDLRIPDTDAESILTPRQLIDYLAKRLPICSTDYSLMDRAFERLRKTISEQAGIPLGSVLPTTSLFDVFPKSDRGKAWAMVGQALNAKRWPRIGERGWFSKDTRSKLDNVEKACAFLVTHSPAAIKSEGEGWTKKQIADVVHRLIVYSLVGNLPYSDDSRFAQDLGFD